MSSMSDSGTGGRGGAELMVEQFHLKVLHAVLAVRGRAAAAGRVGVVQAAGQVVPPPLHDPQPPPAAEGVEAPEAGEPLVVDILLAHAAAGGGGGGGAGGEVVERWTVVCEPWPDAAAGEGYP